MNDDGRNDKKQKKNKKSLAVDSLLPPRRWLMCKNGNGWLNSVMLDFFCCVSFSLLASWAAAGAAAGAAAATAAAAAAGSAADVSHFRHDSHIDSLRSFISGPFNVTWSRSPAHLATHFIHFHRYYSLMDGYDIIMTPYRHHYVDAEVWSRGRQKYLLWPFSFVCKIRKSC